MTSQQSNQAGHGPRETDLFDAAPVNSDAQPAETVQTGFASRLRAAREARGLDLDSCAHALKLPVRVLRKLESGDHAGIDSTVYLASYIRKYAAYLGVEAAVQSELDHMKQVAAPPPLVVTGGISHSRYLLERYATAATYVVLTAVIVVPMIWLGVRGTLDRDMSHLAPLDAAPVAQQEQAAPAASASAAAATAVQLPPPPPRIAPPQADEQPLLASMAPFPGLGGSEAGNKPPLATAPPAAVAAAGGHALNLTLSDASWVEVTAADGSRLEYGLLPAGTDKTYHSNQPLEVRIGNAVGAKVSLDGEPMAIDDYRRSNVAHFRVQVQDGKARPAGT
ncbi:helix-turn-helix domain-containing protein [Frateuria defendens]|uniref:helix-turn-helix domain-containing protein n=1 Tax=Frateuria defendens TaxID=2219559 RepID=UPI0009E3DC71|nr:helix-turn-helix domain-containing protein [Frateuria defendens]